MDLPRPRRRVHRAEQPGRCPRHRRGCHRGRCPQRCHSRPPLHHAVPRGRIFPQAPPPQCGVPEEAGRIRGAPAVHRAAALRRLLQHSARDLEPSWKACSTSPSATREAAPKPPRSRPVHGHGGGDVPGRGVDCEARCAREQRRGGCARVADAAVRAQGPRA